MSGWKVLLPLRCRMLLQQAFEDGRRRLAVRLTLNPRLCRPPPRSPSFNQGLLPFRPPSLTLRSAQAEERTSRNARPPRRPSPCRMRALCLREACRRKRSRSASPLTKLSSLRLLPLPRHRQAATGRLTPAQNNYHRDGSSRAHRLRPRARRAHSGLYEARELLVPLQRGQREFPWLWRAAPPMRADRCAIRLQREWKQFLRRALAVTRLQRMHARSLPSWTGEPPPACLPGYMAARGRQRRDFRTRRWAGLECGQR